ncbi:hypothetical protein Misp03_56790 [Microbispora sp. NBRC 16548]|nr:hypothetical protein Misp03_56790 [Microbispora sp. NBRC 16548]
MALEKRHHRRSQGTSPFPEKLSPDIKPMNQGSNDLAGTKCSLSTKGVDQGIDGSERGGRVESCAGDQGKALDGEQQ